MKSRAFEASPKRLLPAGRKCRRTVGCRSTSLCHTGKEAEGISGVRVSVCHVAAWGGGAGAAAGVADGPGPREPPLLRLRPGRPSVSSSLPQRFFPPLTLSSALPLRSPCSPGNRHLPLRPHADCAAFARSVRRRRACVCMSGRRGAGRVVEPGVGSKSPFSATELLSGPG